MSETDPFDRLLAVVESEIERIKSGGSEETSLILAEIVDYKNIHVMLVKDAIDLIKDDNGRPVTFFVTYEDYGGEIELEWLVDDHQTRFNSHFSALGYTVGMGGGKVIDVSWESE